MSEKDNGSEATVELTKMEKIWATMTPEQRATRSTAMTKGRERAKRQRERDSALKRKAGTSDIDDILELTKRAASLLELAGSRKAVEHLLDIAELVKEAS